MNKLERYLEECEANQTLPEGYTIEELYNMSSEELYDMFEGTEFYSGMPE
jgi:hypothetical protein